MSVSPTEDIPIDNNVVYGIVGALIGIAGGALVMSMMNNNQKAQLEKQQQAQQQQQQFDLEGKISTAIESGFRRRDVEEQQRKAIEIQKANAAKVAENPTPSENNNIITSATSGGQIIDGGLDNNGAFVYGEVGSSSKPKAGRNSGIDFGIPSF